MLRTRSRRVVSPGGTVTKTRERYIPSTGEITYRKVWTEPLPDRVDYVDEKYWDRETTQQTQSSFMYLNKGAAKPNDYEKDERYIFHYPVKVGSLPRGYLGNNAWKTPRTVEQLTRTIRN